MKTFFEGYNIFIFKKMLTGIEYWTEVNYINKTEIKQKQGSTMHHIHQFGNFQYNTG